MRKLRLLSANWEDDFSSLFRSAKADILISSPYVTNYGVEFLLASLQPGLRRSGRLRLLTDLSPQNIYLGSTDPSAIKKLADRVDNIAISHLPRLHAKVYIADSKQAVITSGNLTAGGLRLNYEYGIVVTDPKTIVRIREDLTDFARLGAFVTPRELSAYCRIAERLRKSYNEQLAAVRKELRSRFEAELREADDELIRLRLAGLPITTVFEKTVLYLLRHRRAMSTSEMHPLIEAIHPDLCDNSVDRIINGQHFGKKWKHAVRRAQSHLKDRGLIEQHDGRWHLKAS
jgi:phosphatidylserine/phosphatidylglycerophosphate/cardiolipin synthase-like enzyme